VNTSKRAASWLIVFMLFMGALVNYIDRVNISVTAPMMIKEYGWDTASLGIVFSSFFWGYFLLQIPAGWLADKYGGRRILFGSSILWAALTFLTAFPGNIFGLTAVRAMLGASEASNNPAQASFIGRHLPRALVGRIQGFTHSAISLGPLIATPLAVYCITQWGWRSVYYVFAGLSLLWALAWFWTTKATGMTDDAVAERGAKELAEARTKDGIFENPLSRAEVWGSSMAWFNNSYVFYFFLFWLPTYFVKARGMSVQEMAGLATIPWLVLFCTMNFGGWVVDVIKRKSKHSIFWRRMVFAGGFVWSAIFIYPLQSVETSGQAVVLISLAFLGLGWTWPVASALPIEYAPRKAGLITGFMNSWGQVAGIVAPIITGAVIAGGKWDKAFLVAAVISLLGALLVAIPSRYSTGVTGQAEVPIGRRAVTHP